MSYSVTRSVIMKILASKYLILSQLCRWNKRRSANYGLPRRYIWCIWVHLRHSLFNLHTENGINFNKVAWINDYITHKYFQTVSLMLLFGRLLGDPPLFAHCRRADAGFGRYRTHGYGSVVTWWTARIKN